MKGSTTQRQSSLWSKNADVDNFDDLLCSDDADDANDADEANDADDDDYADDADDADDGDSPLGSDIT